MIEMSIDTIRILLIEDNPVEALLMKSVLTRSAAKNAYLPGVELVSAKLFAAGLECLAEGNIDVVLLDLSLPDADGLETLVKLREQEPNVPVVVLTGRDDESLALEAMQVGAQDYLVKGQVDGPNIVRAVRYAVERHRLQLSLSLIDDLTALYNRRGFMTLAEQHLKTTRRTGKESLLIYADMDGLKRINDTYGHREGSNAIIKVAESLKKTFRDSDIIARIGGDEFVIIAHEAAGENIEAIFDRLYQSLHNFNAQRLVPYDLSVSVGAARISETISSLEELMEEADAAMYKQKQSRMTAR